MAGMDAISVERLRALYEYDAATGRLINRKTGRPAGTPDRDGYLVVSANRKRFFAHRVVWAMRTGDWPTAEIDHINCVRDDNRIENLREATRQENKQNMRAAHKDSRSGFLGVSPRRGRWRAQIMHEGRNRYLGEFSTPEEAHDAYMAAKARWHRGFAGADARADAGVAAKSQRALSSAALVPGAGFEPTLVAKGDFESPRET